MVLAPATGVLPAVRGRPDVSPRRSAKAYALPPCSHLLQAGTAAAGRAIPARRGYRCSSASLIEQGLG